MEAELPEEVTVEATGGSGASGGSYGTNNNSRKTDYAKVTIFNKTYASVSGGAGGGYHAYFADLDGYYWEVAWGPDFKYDDNGLLQF